MSASPRQLLAYSFPPGTTFEGHLVGALERIESGGAMRILDAVFVGRDGESGDLIAVAMSSGSASGMIGKLLSFRLDERERQAATERALQSPAAGLVRSLAEKVEPGAGVVALLVEHTWSLTLADAIARMSGSELVSDFVDAGAIGEAWTDPPPSLAQD